MAVFSVGMRAGMSVIKLDRTRPFSVTFGGESGLQYHQDGQDFDASYELIVANIEKPAEVVESDAPKKRGRPRKE